MLKLSYRMTIQSRQIRMLYPIPTLLISVSKREKIVLIKNNNFIKVYLEGMVGNL